MSLINSGLILFSVSVSLFEISQGVQVQQLLSYEIRKTLWGTQMVLFQILLVFTNASCKCINVSLQNKCLVSCER